MTVKEFINELLLIDNQNLPISLVNTDGRFFDLTGLIQLVKPENKEVNHVIINSVFLTDDNLTHINQ